MTRRSGPLVAAVIAAFFSAAACAPARAATATITLTIPAIEADPYHRPYVAVWIETPQREYVTTVFVWYEGDEWLKDIRQWWRRIGRKGKETYDAVTGATRRPGTYVVHWDGTDSGGEPVADGEYVFNVEASREQGDRSFVRARVDTARAHTADIAGDGELGPIRIEIERTETETESPDR